MCPLTSLFFYGGLRFDNPRKHLFPLLKAYAGDHLVVTEDTIFYRQSPGHSTRFMRKIEKENVELYFKD